MKVILVTPNEVDGNVALDLLSLERIAAHRLASLNQLSSLAGEEIGCVLFVEEALTQADMPGFQQAIATQPAWSDLPLLLIASQETPLVGLAERLFPHSGNVAVLQRPLHPVGLVSAVNVALRARARQLEVRDLLMQRADAVRRRDEFLAMLAHELRNPLAPIRNAVHLMGTLDIREPVFERSRQIIEKQTRHITRLVDDLLDVSRLELGKFELRVQQVDLQACVTAAIEASASITGSQRHTVVVQLAQTALPIMADPVRIEQVLGNVIVNAAKFTPSGGTITIRTWRDDDSAVVCVEDNGIGIKPENLGSVFDLFVQEESSLARSPGGLGIGLTLVKRLVKIHGGAVSIASDGVDRGTRVELRFPLARESPVAAVSSRTPVANTRRRKVLVVEDNADIRDTLGMLLHQWQHDVEFANDGAEGVLRAATWQPDVALIDIGLPGIDGYEVARKIRASDAARGRGVRLIAMTGYGQATDREKALRAGFDLHLLKPVDPAHLERLLAESD
ncbi:MAG TPA: ATP-binding protein [Burkholderiales bacterium]|nr:ATP-binding protein [Burkholderiales bacterium]